MIGKAGSSVNGIDWFWLLAQTHCSLNVPLCTPYLQQGRVVVHGKPIEDGFDENELYRGVLIMANGPTLASRLITDRVVLVPQTREQLEAQFTPAHTPEAIMAHILSRRNGDGAYVYDGAQHHIARVNTLNNDPPTLPRGTNLEQLLPQDFIAYDGSISPVHEVGNKTIVAALLPHAYPDTECFQIKRTGYAGTGIGKVTHFTRDGLKQELFFMYDPAQQQNGYGGLVPVHRTYGEGGRRLEERMLSWDAVLHPATLLRAS